MILKTVDFTLKKLAKLFRYIQFRSVPQSLPTLCDPMNCSTPSRSVHHHFRSLLTFMYIKSVMPSSHLILCRPLLLLPLIPPRVRVFSNESTFHMSWPEDWSFSFSIIPSKCNENERINLKTKCIEFLLSLLCARYTCTTSFLQIEIQKAPRITHFA